MLQTLVRDYSWIHLGIGLFGNFCFVVGSILFFKTFDSYYTLGVWLFVLGFLFVVVTVLLPRGIMGPFFGLIDRRRDRRRAAELGRSEARASAEREAGIDPDEPAVAPGGAGR